MIKDIENYLVTFIFCLLYNRAFLLINHFINSIVLFYSPRHVERPDQLQGVQ